MDCMLDVEGSSSGYAGPRLRRDLRDALLFRLGTFDTETSFEERLGLQVCQRVSSALGGQDYVYHGRLLPTTRHKFVAFCLREDGGNNNLVPRKVSSDLFRDVRVDVVRPPEEKSWRWFALATARQRSVEWSGAPLGPVVTRMRHLESLGYSTVFVPPNEYGRLHNAGRQTRFLVDLIQERRRKSSLSVK